ncbi:MAG: hypothetical protein YHS30scaffold667_41 [Phage 65_10]|nr:MAG: hypothetical protein YHS30scaffold667_41 [Phage 65_10]
MIHIYHLGAHVASISKQHPGADNYRAFEPWLLLHISGRVDRFSSAKDARDEARKHWGCVQFKRS